MNWVVTTSDNYHHCLPIFFKLWERHINEPLDLVGYKKPANLPEYVNFVSLGQQRGINYFTTDLKEYFKTQEQWFVWLFEDCFLKGFDKFEFIHLSELMRPDVGRIGLTRDIVHREHTIYNIGDHPVAFAHKEAKYLISTQPSIWNKDFLLQYMTDGMTPWQFEKQDTIDGWKIYGAVNPAIICNEGVRRSNIFNFNLDGIEL